MVASSYYLIVFRIVHILAGVIWGGSLFLFVVFVQPSAGAIGPAAAPFMAELLGKRRLVDAILWTAAVSIAGGLLLYWHDWHAYGGLGTFLGLRIGLVLTIGAISAMIGFLLGLFGTRPRVMRFMALGRSVAASGGPPAPEVATEMGKLQGQLKVLARSSLALVIIATLAMSTARYW